MRDPRPGPLLTRNIALIGFMAAGKTQVGLMLSRMTGWPFRDIDLLIEGLERATVEEIFRRSGEPYFRRLETTILGDLCRGAGQIIGCGGGTVLAAENRRLLQERCLTVWLKVSQDQVLARLSQPGAPARPLLRGPEAGSAGAWSPGAADTEAGNPGAGNPAAIIPSLLRTRIPFYSEADLAIETDGRTIEEVAREIALTLRLPEAASPQEPQP